MVPGLKTPNQATKELLKFGVNGFYKTYSQQSSLYHGFTCEMKQGSQYFGVSVYENTREIKDETFHSLLTNWSVKCLCRNGIKKRFNILKTVILREADNL